MLGRLRLNSRPFLSFGSGMLFCCSALQAQENCNVEVKLLLSPTDTLVTVKAFNAKKETSGRVYLFDTESFDLFRQGAIVRLRRGPQNDLTVKLRLSKGEKSLPLSEGSKGFKCEVDLTGAGPVSSYSVIRRFLPEQILETGDDISGLLSPAQKQLLKEAQVSVDWSRIKRIAEITSTSWQTETQPHLGKLSLELWKWPGGKILELSTRVSRDAGLSTYLELQRLVSSERLSMSPIQKNKTSIVLEAITHTSRQ